MANIVSGLGVVVLHTVVIYVFLTAFLSFLGYRELSELGIVELVVVMVLGSAVETAMVAGDTSLQAGLASATTLLVCNRLFSLGLHRWRWLRRTVVGRPIPVVHRGRFLPRQMREAGLTEDDVRQGIRARGYGTVEEVRIAVLEIDGSISVVPEEKDKKSG